MGPLLPGVSGHHRGGRGASPRIQGLLQSLWASPSYLRSGLLASGVAPVFKFALILIYTMRRVDCPTCGMVVEKVPWASGKHRLCDGFRLLLARWARQLSWEETALAFNVSWADVYASVEWVVEYGLQHRVLKDTVTIGIDEICVRVGRVFWTLIYQIDEDMTRLLWVGHDRTERTLLEGFDSLGEEALSGLRFVCSDTWASSANGSTTLYPEYLAKLFIPPHTRSSKGHHHPSLLSS